MKWQSNSCYGRKLTPTPSMFYINCKNTVPPEAQCNQLLPKLLVTSLWYPCLKIACLPQPEMPVLRHPPCHSSKEATLCHTWIPPFLSDTPAPTTLQRTEAPLLKNLHILPCFDTALLCLLYTLLIIKSLLDRICTLAYQKALCF